MSYFRRGSCRKAAGVFAGLALICLATPGGTAVCLAADDGPAPAPEGVAAPDAAAPAAQPDSAPPAEEKPAKVVRTQKFGSRSGDRYVRGGRDTSAWILGFDRTKATIMGKPMIGMLEPVYARDAGVENENEDRIVAREGYVVGEVELDIDTFLRAVRVKFYRLEGGKVDPSDSYHSRWIGKRRNKRTQTLPGNGAKIVGIYGSADEAIRSIGLLVLEQ